MKILILFFLFGLQASAATTYQLIWKNQAPLKLKYRLYELTPAFASKVGTHGSILKIEQLMPVQELRNHEVRFESEKSTILALVAESPTGGAADFFVAPHHTHPASSGLDFKFNCLCYQHVYHLEKGKLWYRIMRLSHNGKDDKLGKLVRLEHDMIPWEELKSSPTPSTK